ncbi:hypothetical protein CANCADRAFT_14027, partial [Tortispora caseinolytica NRRL Y-17796]
RNKHFFILSAAGKPIFSLYGSDELVTSYTAVIQAFVNYFNDPNSSTRLKSFKSSNILFVIEQKDTLIYAAASKLGESELQLQSQLDILHTQILSTLTSPQLLKAFQNRQNFDLRKLLSGTDVFLSALSRSMALGSPPILLGALECLYLTQHARMKIADCLLKGRVPSMLYGLIVADSRLVAIARPRRESLHPPDLQLLFSMLFHTSVFQNGEEHWVPICLPKFNSKGFLYAYIHFFQPGVALVLISADRHSFFSLKEAKNTILDKMHSTNSIQPIEESIKNGRNFLSHLNAAPIRHFLFKSRKLVQLAMPDYPPYFHSDSDASQLMSVYRHLHTLIHGPYSSFRSLHAVNKSASAMVWVTNEFEVYCVSGPYVKRSALTKSLNQLVSWIYAHEKRLFIHDGAVF